MRKTNQKHIKNTIRIGLKGLIGKSPVEHNWHA